MYNKIMSAILALTMCVGLALPAMAVEEKEVLSSETIAQIKSVEEKMQPALEEFYQQEGEKNIIVVKDGYVVGEVHTDGYVITYDYENGKLSDMADNEGNEIKIERDNGSVIERKYINNKLVRVRMQDPAEVETVLESGTIEEGNPVVTATAPTASNYIVNGKNMSNLMSNAEFTAQSMTRSEIQNLFEEYGSILQNEIAIYYLKDGELVSYGEGYLASRSIYNMADFYGVNPKVILCTMQKESSIITNKNLHANMRAVYYCMGYGATDSGDIDEYTGIDNQIAGGTGRLKELYNESNWNATLTVNGGKTFTYNGVTYPAQITPANRATHALYRWTPWVFDTSLTPFSGGNYLFLQVKDMFWNTWY